MARPAPTPTPTPTASAAWRSPTTASRSPWSRPSSPAAARRAALPHRRRRRPSRVRDFDVEHEKRMHLIVVRRDADGFQHLHPELGADGTWRVRADAPRRRRVPRLRRLQARRRGADAGRRPRRRRRAATTGCPRRRRPPRRRRLRRQPGRGPRARRPRRRAALHRRRATAGGPHRALPRRGGHLVALREGDLAYLHVHPAHGDEATTRGRVRREFPSAGRYRLFLQFRHAGRVHTAAFTQEVAR